MYRRIYNLDRLIEYGTEAIPHTTRVINPAWRHLDRQIRHQNGLLSREVLQFAEIQLRQEMEPKEVEAYERKKGQLQQAIEECRQQIEQLKAQRKALAKHIEIKDLPDKDRFQRLRSEKKHFIDTIKLIAYRAETAIAQLAREKLKRLDDARSLIRQAGVPGARPPGESQRAGLKPLRNFREKVGPHALPMAKVPRKPSAPVPDTTAAHPP